LPFGTQKQAGESQIESARQPHQNHRLWTGLLALNLADRRFGDAGTVSQIGQRPAPRLTFEAKAARDPNPVSSIKVDICPL
jgi:hypothetical protein